MFKIKFIAIFSTFLCIACTTTSVPKHESPPASPPVVDSQLTAAEQVDFSSSTTLEEENDWVLASSSKDPSMLLAFIEKYPNSSHAGSANLRLRLLSKTRDGSAYK